MMPREPVWHEPIHRHTDEYFARLSDLQTRYPHIPTYELERFMSNPPSLEAPPKPAPPKPPRTKAQILWPYLPSSEEK
jgi:hypothetical protein